MKEEEIEIINMKRGRNGENQQDKRRRNGHNQKH